MDGSVKKPFSEKDETAKNRIALPFPEKSLKIGAALQEFRDNISRFNSVGLCL